jgi:uncharacterized tellurite resistance protein B-like protein
MENLQDPQQWSLRQWLAFLLLTAAEVDGLRARMEMRYIRVELGNDVVDAMLAQMNAWMPAERESILHNSLHHFVQTQGAREKLQQMLRHIFIADGEYGPAEQAMTQQIGAWLRDASAQ